MLIFPNCKINLGLRIVGKRPDGFHDLETIFLPVPWHDALEIIESDIITIQITGQEIPGEKMNNLCIKAWHILKEDFPELPPVEIHLHKTIPTGAGLGGGSSNGAFMLRLLNDKFGLGLTREQLVFYALQLGSDCPFFILNEPVLAKGRGERMEPLALNLQGNFLVLVNPGLHISTAWAFSSLSPTPAGPDFQDIVQHPMEEWNERGLINDFEIPVFEQFPSLLQIKQSLVEMGAAYAAMSGTGSTCFGIFRQEPSPSRSLFNPAFLVKTMAL